MEEVPEKRRTVVGYNLDVVESGPYKLTSLVEVGEGWL